ncbi:MAG: ORF6N domain-containing protein [Prosthecochloris sp.]|uniref:ORF6N domain-containing protein n=1 Tax=Prosthecochloris sp. ZM TaxID=2283143 RepID=UPI001AC007C5|nr:ORF6N domain-containing protein [Prosthecochloris sp. ZM]MBO8092065.1 ORF6N domain-containing protein [Prosthecochloris sp.]
MQTEHIQNLIFTIRGVPVMLDRDLAVVYGVETKVLNQAVKRNIARFPQEFRFQINEEERDELVTICDRFEPLKHSTVNPYAFTEQGVSMLSAVLRSDTAVKVSIQIMNAFVQMRRFIQDNAKVFERLELVERRQLVFESETEKNFEKVFQALERRDTPPEQGIFYNGQVYDAWSFASDLVRRAEKSLVLIDNYVDDSVLTLLSKRSADVLCTIYTKTISRQLALDLKKHNQQYPQIALKSFPDAHDRFLLIDGVEIYHIGASLKDLGKKWFAFSRFETGALEMLNKLEGK